MSAQQLCVLHALPQQGGVISGTGRSRPAEQKDGLTCVRETPLDRVVGMQQKTARPKANSGGRNGSRRAASAAHHEDNTEVRTYQWCRELSTCCSHAAARRGQQQHHDPFEA